EMEPSWLAIAGDVASILGLVAAVIGFPWAILGQRRIQRAVQRVAWQVLLADLDELSRLLSALRTLSRAAQWPRSVDRCDDAQHLALRLVSHPHLSEEDRRELRAGADDLGTISTYILTKKLTSANPPAAFHQPKRAALDRFLAAVEGIRG